MKEKTFHYSAISLGDAEIVLHSLPENQGNWTLIKDRDHLQKQRKLGNEYETKHEAPDSFITSVTLLSLK